MGRARGVYRVDCLRLGAGAGEVEAHDAPPQATYIVHHHAMRRLSGAVTCAVPLPVRPPHLHRAAPIGERISCCLRLLQDPATLSYCGNQIHHAPSAGAAEAAKEEVTRSGTDRTLVGIHSMRASSELPLTALTSVSYTTAT